MEQKKVGILFSMDLTGDKPLSHIGAKLPVYERLLKLCRDEGWEVYVLTHKTYIGGGIFNGGWLFDGEGFNKFSDPIKIDLVYDRSGGVKFPPEGDNSLVWVNERDFKLLAWDKWKTYKDIGKYMPQTFLVEKEKDIPRALSKIETEMVVIKPFSGLKGVGIFIGKKGDAEKFKLDKRYKRYVVQEFVDTKGGIPGITAGMHDLRIVIVNGKAVWCHVRVPIKGSLLANAAQGGSLTEVDYQTIPQSIKQVVEKISEKFSKNYNNPVYSLDFGVGSGAKPYIFEINDQIGFPRWEMNQRDAFLNGLVANFKSKLVSD